MVTDVKASYRASDGQFQTESSTDIARTRVKAVYVAGTGIVIIKDGGAIGVARITVNVTAGSYMLLPGDGILFATNVHLTLGGATSVTIFHG